MGNYVNNGVVTLVGNVDYDNAVREIATLVGVGKREDGRYYLADACVAKGINYWSWNKPSRGDVNDPLQLQKGIYVPYFTYQEIWDVADSQRYFKHNAPRGKDYGEYNKLRQFHGYNHYATKPIMSVIAPNSTITSTPIYFKVRITQAIEQDNVTLTNVLGETVLVVLMRIKSDTGDRHLLYNTGKRLVHGEFNKDVNIELNIDFLYEGENIEAIVCAVADTSLATGFVKLDNYTGTFTPLNLTPALEAEKFIPIVANTFVLSFDTVVLPSASQNYFQVGVNTCIMRDRIYSTSEATQTLRFEMLLRRDGVEVEGSVASKDYTFTYTVGAEQNGGYIAAYVWANGIQIPPLPVTPETGDELIFRVVDPKTYVTKSITKIHTY